MASQGGQASNSVKADAKEGEEEKKDGIEEEKAGVADQTL